MTEIIPNYSKWVIPGVELEEKWEYRDFQEYPPGNAPEETIREFIKDAKEAEKVIFDEYVESGIPEDEARNKACQWPLRKETPMDVIRNFIGYQYAIQQAEENGVDL